MQQKRILLVMSGAGRLPARPDWFVFPEQVQALLPNAQVSITALPRLTFTIIDNTVKIFDAAQGLDVADFDLVVFRTIGRHLELAVAVAAYCRVHNVRYIDPVIPQTSDAKLTACVVGALAGVTIPNTLFGPVKNVATELERGRFGWPLIAKDNHGKKGRNNFLVQNIDELYRVLDDHKDVTFITQSYIPNDGDYRIVVLNGKARVAIFRTAVSGSHLNNTSQGGEAQLLPMKRVPKAVIQLAEQATAVEQLAVAGADVIVDKNTDVPYILEVNSAPQLHTGAFTTEKMRAYAAALQELLA